MEQLKQLNLPVPSSNGINKSVISDEPFITANTINISQKEIMDKHIIPVFVKDNTPLISHLDFVELARQKAEAFYGTRILSSSVRVSHPIKGRIYSARKKPVKELLDHEKTIYYERMAFTLTIPGFRTTLYGKEVDLKLVGVKSYQQDNLYQKSGGIQKFKIGIGYQVLACTNLCLTADGAAFDIEVQSIEGLSAAFDELLNSFDPVANIENFSNFDEDFLTEQQFANLLGRCRMFPFVDKEAKSNLPNLQLSDRMVSLVAKNYYKDNLGFGSGISLWDLYNLFTDAVKVSYIDTFLDRNLGAFELVKGIQGALDGEGEYKWFLN